MPLNILGRQGTTYRHLATNGGEKCGLGELAEDLVFVGGCATGLLLTDPAAAPVRVTYDVDAIVQVFSHRILSICREA